VISWAMLRDVLAVLGSVLGVVLIVLRFLDTRPVVVLEWVEGKIGRLSNYRLRIRNTSRYPIHIGAVRIWLPWREKGAYERVWGDDWELPGIVASSMAKSLDLYIAEGK